MNLGRAEVTIDRSTVDRFGHGRVGVVDENGRFVCSCGSEGNYDNIVRAEYIRGLINKDIQQ